jgi:hypothetical protein
MDLVGVISRAAHVGASLPFALGKGLLVEAM